MTGKNKKGKKNSRDEQEEYEEQQRQESAARAEAERKAAEETKPQAPAKPEPKAAEMAYAKSDFVRGDEVFFEDQLVGEQLGEFPSQWDLLRGNAEIAKLNGETVIIAPEYDALIAPFFDNKKYLPEKFTLEFDFFATEIDRDADFRVYLTNEEDYNTAEIPFGIYPASNSNGGYINIWYEVTEGDGRNSDQYAPMKMGEWNHFALSFNQRSLKVYINGIRYINIPRTIKPDWVSFEFRNWGEQATNKAIKNIVLAKGAVPLYDRMMNDGKFITYGITFDVGKAVIKPESMGEITRIVQLMNENPTLKFSVEGHTDSTGNATSNQTLSEARAKAIVDKLVENGIARDRLSAVGKGQNSPIADNGTDEGRAKNRRVEFVKQ